MFVEYLTIYGVVCVQLAHFSIGDWKDISIAHVIIIIKSEVSTFPIVIIFFRGCVPKMFVASYSVTYCIYVPGRPGICLHYYCVVYDECKYSDTSWLADRTRLFAQYTISLSSLCKLIWRHCTYKCLRYILSSVWVRLSIFSPLSIIQYVGLYVFSLPIPLVMVERIYILCFIIIIKSKLWTFTHCLGHETMVSAVWLSKFLYQYIGHRVRRGHGSLFIVYLSTLLLLPYTVFTADRNGVSFRDSGSFEWFITQTCGICTGSTQFRTTSLNGNSGATRFRDNGAFAKIFEIFFLLANMCKFGE